MKNKEPFDFERFKEEAMEGLYNGKKMGGTDGVFAPMLKHLLESILEGELDNHLQESKSSSDPNRRNGKTKKNVRSLQSGEFELESTCDRNGTFEPKIVAKRQLIITDELEENVIAIYARGMSTRNISDYVKEMYAMEISATEISNITDRIIPAMNEWRPDL
jgi:putative transposase